MSVTHYVNGSFVSKDDALISAMDLGVHRGYGVFDYIKIYKGQPFHLKNHLKRLKWSAEQIELSLPMPFDALYDLCLTLIRKNAPIDGGIRLIVTGGLSSADQLLPIDDSSLIILFHPFTAYPPRYYEEGMRVITTKTLRLYPSVKSTNYMPAILAMKKAKATGFDDALYVNQRDEILEGTTCNAFFFKGDTLITADSEEIVKGVTRSVFLEITKKEFPIEFRSIHINEVQSCDEAFLTSSVKNAIPLVQIDDKKVGNGLPGPRTAHLRALFKQYLLSYLSEKSSLAINS